MFDLDYKKFSKILPRSFLATAWEFASSHNIKLPFHKNYFPLRRTGDQYLMEAFTNPDLAHPFSPSELASLNCCRLYLQVTTLADIVDGSGLRISKRAKDGIRDHTRPHYHPWPVQAKPGPSQWTLWRKALKQCFPLTPDKSLQHPLGAWIDGQQEQWTWYYLPVSKRVFQRHHTGWKVYVKNAPQGPIKRHQIQI